MEDTIEVKHMHENVGVFNGSLYFLIKEHLFRVDVGTPHYNDYNEWRLSDFTISQDPYDASGNEVELVPYEKFEPIFISEDDFNFLLTASKAMNGDLSEEEHEELNKKDSYFAEYGEELSGVRYKDFDDLHFYNQETDSEIYYLDWVNKDENDKTPFEKIFYPIINGFMKGYCNKHYKEE